MQAVEELWKTYQDWKRLTEEEGTAIQRSHWYEVHSAQQQKRALQTDIVRLTDEIKANFRNAREEKKFDTRLRGIVNELILLETQNNLKVQACIASAQEKTSSLEATANRLRQVHTRYVPPRDPIWQNLS